MTEEPKQMRSQVLDRDGDLWERGRTRWNCLAPVDGQRVRRPGRLPWFALEEKYGPLEIVRIGGPR